MIDNSQETRYSGVIALTTVIIISGLLIASGITIVLTSIDLRKSTKSNVGIVRADINSRTCLEESVQRLKYDTSYTGSLMVTLSEGSCEANITDDINPDNKVISYKGSSNESSVSYTVRLDITEYPFSIIE
jgi:hypothetical protein